MIPRIVISGTTTSPLITRSGGSIAFDRFMVHKKTNSKVSCTFRMIIYQLPCFVCIILYLNLLTNLLSILSIKVTKHSNNLWQELHVKLSLHYLKVIVKRCTNKLVNYILYQVFLGISWDIQVNSNLVALYNSCYCMQITTKLPNHQIKFFYLKPKQD